MKWISEIFGFFALLSSVMIYSQNKRSRILIFKGIQDLFWGIHYLLLSCFPAAATSIICLSRSFVFYHSEKKWAKGRFWVIAYIGFYIISAVLTWQNIYSILPASASCISTIAFFQKAPEKTKMLQICASLVTLSYNLLQSHSIAVYAGVTLTLTTAALSLIRHYQEKNRLGACGKP